MAIRIRKINGHTVALCAAITKPGPGEQYLDDTIHHALSVKFSNDYNNEGLWPLPVDSVEVDRMLKAEMEE